MPPTDPTETKIDTAADDGAPARGRGGRSGRKLVIVESPAKAKTISGLLGPDFVVESSIGHIRDLATRKELPEAFKHESWADLAVDVDNGFKPVYVVSPEKKAQVSKLKKLAGAAGEVYLATDEDREGESIAWHLSQVLGLPEDTPRMVFHEITPQAIQRAVEECRTIDPHLVEAQEARRIFDRIYGFKLSDVMRRKTNGRSAGRVQSVATRMVVDRERARMAFRSADWWGIDATVTADGAAARAAEADVPRSFSAALVAVDGTPLATGRDFDAAGHLDDTSAVVVLDEAAARALSAGLEGGTLTVASMTHKPYRRSPRAPFITSTLQQEAGRKLRFSSKRTMQVAQHLYEEGWITYMRTDSTTLSDQALAAARAQAAAMYGPAYVPSGPRLYTKKVKNAQEAHEAIRPAGETFRTPDEAARSLRGDEFRLYDLIWKRTIASQMSDATGTSAQVRLTGSATVHTELRTVEFAASGTVIEFPGFQRAYVEGEDDPEAELADREVRLPPMAEGDPASLSAVDPGGHATQPPARYTEASLVKAMEDIGVGRPSTYASIVSTILDRGYVWKKGSAMVPSLTAFGVVGLLEQHFADLVDYGLTASMEDDLDEIAGGDQDMARWLGDFYFGPDGSGGLRDQLSENLDTIDAGAVNAVPIGTAADGQEIVARSGKYGPYLKKGEETVSIPEDLAPDELTVEKAEELLAAPSADRVLGTDPETGIDIHVKAGRFGPYVQLGDMVDGGPKPRTSSLFSSMAPATLTFEQALELLRIPRLVGTDPDSGQEIVAHNGKFGPYLKKGTDSRSLQSEDQLLTVTLDTALAIFAQPKTRGRNARGPLRELGPDPDTGLAMVVKDGRFGPYVTDGTTNASLRIGDDVESLTVERSSELLAERRAAGPAKKKSAAKKAPAKKKSVAKKKSAAKKAPAKRTAAKKAAVTKKASATEPAATGTAAATAVAGESAVPGASDDG
jgi:DNA topoisomerase-1